MTSRCPLSLWPAAISPKAATASSKLGGIYFFPMRIFFSYSLHSFLFCISFRCAARRLEKRVLCGGVPCCFKSPSGPVCGYYVVLTLFPGPPLTPPWLLCNHQPVLLRPSPFLAQPRTPPAPPPPNCQPALCMGESVPILFLYFVL